MYFLVLSEIHQAELEFQKPILRTVLIDGLAAVLTRLRATVIAFPSSDQQLQNNRPLIRPSDQRSPCSQPII